MSAITKFAQDLAAADKTFTSAVNVVAEGIARAFGTDVTFDEWEQGSAEFRSAYTAARGCTEATATNRWSFVCKELKEQFGLEKPRKPSAEAEKKAAQRGDKAAKVDAVLAQHATLESLTKAAQKADKTEAKVYAEALLKKAGEVQKEAQAAAKERVKALKAELSELAKGLTLAQLEAVVKHARKYTQAAQDDASPAQDAPDAPAQAEAPQTAMAQALAGAGLVEA